MQKPRRAIRVSFRIGDFPFPHSGFRRNRRIRRCFVANSEFVASKIENWPLAYLAHFKLLYVELFGFLDVAFFGFLLAIFAISMIPAVAPFGHIL